MFCFFVCVFDTIFLWTFPRTPYLPQFETPGLNHTTVLPGCKCHQSGGGRSPYWWRWGLWELSGSSSRGSWAAAWLPGGWSILYYARACRCHPGWSRLRSEQRWGDEKYCLMRLFSCTWIRLSICWDVSSHLSCLSVIEANQMSNKNISKKCKGVRQDIVLPVSVVGHQHPFSHLPLHLLINDQ